ncbi:hypothetical protein [Fluviispira sanaruensis]|uniref:Uncharacterized protein n=1 Tax=Fluviispira sanaruensis TaxID=2493639 RepID=A0A4P2VQL6_FLUSA|nr:hypothetical protein [Fluviispira sanaruensis]BBH54710.1 hypothetical protein JCM31447_31840 [Fluviispira sanaruensis]
MKSNVRKILSIISLSIFSISFAAHADNNAIEQALLSSSANQSAILSKIDRTLLNMKSDLNKSDTLNIDNNKRLYDKINEQNEILKEISANLKSILDQSRALSLERKKEELKTSSNN